MDLILRFLRQLMICAGIEVTDKFSDFSDIKVRHVSGKYYALNMKYLLFKLNKFI